MIMKILKLEWESCGWYLPLQEGVLGGQPWQCLGYEPKENLDKARPKDMANLATSSREMPLNQQLQPATIYKYTTWIITIGMVLADLRYMRGNYHEPGHQRARDENEQVLKYVHEHVQWTWPQRAWTSEGLCSQP